MLKVGIAGGSGYGGLEVLSLLHRHPGVSVVSISSDQYVGSPVENLYPHLRAVLDLQFSTLSETLSADTDILFLALPHGQAQTVVPNLPEKKALIDLSGDFRIHDADLFESYYGFPNSAQSYQPQFVYGLPELNRTAISSARRIANPGCFATATILALHPLYEENWIDGPVFVDAKTGSSGSGRKPTAGTHHPRRSHSLFPYKPFRHQHLPEMRQILSSKENPLIFQPHSTPLVRGIFSSHYMRLKEPKTLEEVASLFEDYYGSERFIRWCDSTVDVSSIEHANYVDLGAATDGEFLVVWAALDNLQKGAAGQAIQNMNIMFDFDEHIGLETAPIFP